MHCAADVAKVPSRSPAAGQGSSSSTALVGHRHGPKKSLAGYLTESLWFIVEMAGQQPRRVGGSGVTGAPTDAASDHRSQLEMSWSISSVKMHPTNDHRAAGARCGRLGCLPCHELGQVRMASTLHMHSGGACGYRHRPRQLRGAGAGFPKRTPNRTHCLLPPEDRKSVV